MFGLIDVDETRYVGDSRECLLCGGTSVFGEELYQMFLCREHYGDLRSLGLDELMTGVDDAYRHRLACTENAVKGRTLTSAWFACYPYAIGMEFDTGDLVLVHPGDLIPFVSWFSSQIRQRVAVPNGATLLRTGNLSSTGGALERFSSEKKGMRVLLERIATRTAVLGISLEHRSESEHPLDIAHAIVQFSDHSTCSVAASVTPRTEWCVDLALEWREPPWLRAAPIRSSETGMD